MSSDITLRHMATDADFEACLELQRETWGEDFHEVVPAAILKISQKVSGIAAGAFRDDQMLGFVYGLTGIREDRSAHWSHMLAVTRDARGLGLGKKLKLFQRDYLLGVGVEVVFWSYDPLVARNANLNFNCLGARPVEYVRDMYGADTGSELHSALGTDRFVVAWEIASTVVGETIDEKTVECALPSSADLLVNADWTSGEVLRGVDALTASRDAQASSKEFWVEVPDNIERVKHGDMNQARAWRATTRAALVSGMEQGFVVDGFAIGDPSGGGGRRYFYRLRTP